MRLARKLILAMVVGLTVVFVANAYYRVRRERAAFDHDMRQDHAILAQVLSKAVAEVWTSAGREAAMGLVEKLAAPSQSLHVRWIDSRDSVAQAASKDTIVTHVPICTATECPGFVEISESLDVPNAYARHTLLRTGVVSLVGLGCAGLLCMLVGIWFVGKPMQLLVDKARRIGNGDIEGPLAIQQRDEIGELATEMNAMCLRLMETRYALHAETEERLRAQEQLRHADRLATVGKLASGIAHELGTPLGVALVRANMVAANAASPKEVREAARIIGEQIDRITHIVRQLMDFARGRVASAPGPNQRRQPANLQKLAEQAVAMLTPLAVKRNLAFELVAPENPPEPPANPEQIQQVLVNLMVNAIHASEKPGKILITVAADAANPPADVTPPVYVGMDKPRYAMVSVKDEGVGIAPDILPRIFEPFFTTKHVGEGTGLGLSVAYGIVREHGGWIEVTSARTKGSCFSVYLPMDVAEVV
jgi:two-component system, NtrC family, sensor kinase